MTTQVGDIANLIAELQRDVAQTQSEAEREVGEAQEAVAAMSSEKARLVVTRWILGIFGVAILGYGAWAIFGSAGGFVCADQAEQAAGTCSGQWVETKAVLESIVITALLPLVTLALGYYFGKAPESDA